MVVYFFMLLISLFLAYKSIKSENQKTKNIYLFLAMLPFILISSIRVGVGTDYYPRYVRDYNLIALNKTVYGVEFGFKMLIYFCLLFTKNSQMLFIVTSILINWLIFATLKDNCKGRDLIVSILIYFLGGFFFQSLNLVRQFLAMSLVFWGYKFLFKDKGIRWFILICFLALLIHNSSIVVIGLIFLKNKLIFKPKLTILLTTFITILGNYCFGLLELVLQYTRFKYYLSGRYAHADISWFYIIVFLIIYCFSYYLYTKKDEDKKDKKGIFFVNVTAVTLLFMALNSVHMLFSRISYYFAIFQIISIPYFIEMSKVNLKLKILEMKNKKKKKLVWKEKKLSFNDSQKLMYIMVIFFFLAIFTYTNIINNDNEPLPYQTIFYTEKVGTK